MPARSNRRLSVIAGTVYSSPSLPLANQLIKARRPAKPGARLGGLYHIGTGDVKHAGGRFGGPVSSPAARRTY